MLVLQYFFLVFAVLENSLLNTYSEHKEYHKNFNLQTSESRHPIAHSSMNRTAPHKVYSKSKDAS